MDRHEAALFTQSLRNVFARFTAAELDDALDDVGWHEAMVDDDVAATALLFTLQGETGVTTSAIGYVMTYPLDVGNDAMAVLPAAGGCAPPGSIEGRRLHVDGLAPIGLAGRFSGRVVATAADGTLGSWEVRCDDLDLYPVDGVDPDMQLLRVTGDIEVDHPGWAVEATKWAEMVARGRMAIAHQLVGASRAMLDLACDHARERVQFGRPIASFQAVRHRLAEAQVAISMAEAMVDAAWCDMDPLTPEEARTQASAMAKAVAGRQAKTVARHCQQVLAGIGFTVEHPFHRYVRRVLMLDALLGSSASLTASLGQELIDGRRLPPLLPLERSHAEQTRALPEWSRDRGPA